jgi:hypothetical protein
LSVCLSIFFKQKRMGAADVGSVWLFVVLLHLNVRTWSWFWCRRIFTTSKKKRKLLVSYFAFWLNCSFYPFTRWSIVNCILRWR